MKDLHLKRTIPLLGIGTFALVGCGGRAMDEPGGEDEVGLVSDENFEEALLSSLLDYCQRQERCGSSDYDDPQDCAEYYASSTYDAFDLESTECRKRMLQALDCLAQQSCDDEAYYGCISELGSLSDLCSVYDYDDYEY